MPAVDDRYAFLEKKKILEEKYLDGRRVSVQDFKKLIKFMKEVYSAMSYA
jgi:hypothetical protein